MSDSDDLGMGKVKECLDRLEAAHRFPWDVRLKLMSETIIAMAESQMKTSQRVCDLATTAQQNLADLIRKVSGVVG